ncbi:SPO11 (predicted) [Pycnogonum litorale]
MAALVRTMQTVQMETVNECCISNWSNFDFWHKLSQLRKELLQNKSILLRLQDVKEIDGLNAQQTQSRPQTKASKDEEALLRLEVIITNLLRQVVADETSVQFQIPSRNKWSNMIYDERIGIRLKANPSCSVIKFSNPSSLRRIKLLVKLMSKMYELIQNNRYSTKRDLYYEDPQLYGNQKTVDDGIDDISCLLNIPRWRLHVLATSKGCVAGDLAFSYSNNQRISCVKTTTGVLIPNGLDNVYDIRSSAKFILVVEKDATFQKLLDANITTKFHPCIMITGKGFPDVNTRRLLKILWQQLEIPILALVDANPHGLEIMTVYKYGSMTMSFCNEELIVPEIKWLGILPSDIVKLNIDVENLIPLTQRDKNKAWSMLQKPYFKDNLFWKQQLELMIKMNTKAEIQTLSSVCNHFLTEVYLPEKIKNGDWL